MNGRPVARALTAYPVAAGRCHSCGQAKGATWTPREIILAIKRWAREHGGEPPTARAWKLAQNGYPSVQTVRKMFGTFNAGIRAAGSEPRPQGGCPWSHWTREKVIQAVFEWNHRYGRLPRSRDWKNANQRWPSPNSVYRLFGGWNAMLAEAGYSPNHRWTRRRVAVTA